jgi:hypothetical protein
VSDFCALLGDLRDECAFASASEPHDKNANRSSNKLEVTPDSLLGLNFWTYREDGAFWLKLVVVRAEDEVVLEGFPRARVCSGAS